MQGASVTVRRCDSGALLTVSTDGKHAVQLLPRDAEAGGGGGGTSTGGVENMDNLMHLHEASILHNVRLRFQRDDIYTGTGSCSSSFTCVFGTGSGAQGSHAVLGC